MSRGRSDDDGRPTPGQLRVLVTVAHAATPLGVSELVEPRPTPRAVGSPDAAVASQVHAVRRGAADHRFHAVAALEARDQMALAVRSLLAMGMSTEAVAKACDLSLVSVLSLEHLADQVLKEPSPPQRGRKR
jgi:hypothetical protein